MDEIDVIKEKLNKIRSALRVNSGGQIQSVQEGALAYVQKEICELELLIGDVEIEFAVWEEACESDRNGAVN